VKLRELLNRVQLRSVQAGDGERPVDNVDGLASAPVESLKGVTDVPAVAPTHWVPSQQDERPHH
jgi:hypothetical protein